MSNCGCFPRPPTRTQAPSRAVLVTPHGDKCVVGGGFFNDWCYPTDTTARQVVADVMRALADTGSRHDLHVSRFQTGRFLDDRVQMDVHGLRTCVSLHPRAAGMRVLMYARDPDYLGTLRSLTQPWEPRWTPRRSAMMNHLLHHRQRPAPEGALQHRWSTGYSLRQCKASVLKASVCRHHALAPGRPLGPYKCNDTRRSRGCASDGHGIVGRK